jgi:hypothetical protein
LTAGPRLKILVVSAYDGTDAHAVRDYLLSFRLHSRHDVFYVFDCRRVRQPLDLAPFDVVVVFWEVFLLGPELTPSLRADIARARALKVVFLQDEHRDVHAVDHTLGELGVHVVFTCVAESDHAVFYPPASIPTLEGTYTVLPGYVPRYLEGARLDPGRARPLDIGYRSRAMPYYLGDLAQQKTIVAERFQALAAAHGLTADISVREGDRFYGRPWVEFLRACRCVLGTSSGASVVDFTGAIRRGCERHLALYPDAGYADVKARWFADADGKVVIDTVSPRVFEAAALGCTLVHHEGAYAGVLEADAHYIRVERDYANVGDVIDRIRDHGFCREMARHTHQALVASGRYSYATFVGRFDAILDAHVPHPRRARAVGPVRFYAQGYWRHGQTMIPWGRSFVVAPSGQLAQHLTRLGLARLPRTRRGPLLSRLVHNPAGIARKAWAAGRALRRDGTLRRIVATFWTRPDLRARVPLHGLLDDLLRLDLLRRLWEERPPRAGFTLELEHGPAGALVIASVPRPPHRGGAAAEGTTAPGAPLPGALADALRRGAIRVMIWDHSAVAPQIVDPRAGGRGLTFTLGTGGVYRFRALERVYAADPEGVGHVLATLLGGRARG